MNINEENDDAFDILVYATEAFNNCHYFRIGMVSKGEDDKIVMQIKDFPERKNYY